MTVKEQIEAAYVERRTARDIAQRAYCVWLEAREAAEQAEARLAGLRGSAPQGRQMPALEDLDLYGPAEGRTWGSGSPEELVDHDTYREQKDPDA